MATIVTRSGKGSPLTHAEVDSNFTNLNTDKLELSGGTMTGNLSFGDNDKAIFGAGSDLQIYHDGSNSYIKDTGTGDLYLQGSANVRITNTFGQKFFLGQDNGEAQLYYGGAEKLATKSTGIDVTGTVTADGLTVDGDAVINDPTPSITLNDTNGTNQKLTILHNGSSSFLALRDGTNYGSLQFYADNGTTTRTRFNLSYNGDISFYEDTGTTPKFFWDASVEGLGIGDTSFTNKLNVTGSMGSAGTPLVQLYENSGSARDGLYLDYTGTTNSAVYSLKIADASKTHLAVRGDGNVGIGTSSPAYDLHIHQNDSTNALIHFTNTATGSTGTDGFTIGLDAAEQAFIWQRENLPMLFATNSTERMRIDSSGNLQVSTGQFTVGTTASTGLQFINDGTFGTIHSADLKFRTASSERMRITSAGDVGIGTSTVSDPLHIKATRGIIRLEPTAIGGTTYRIRNGISGASEGGLSFYDVTNAATRLAIDSSGNVGLGTSSPSEELHVKAPAATIRIEDNVGSWDLETDTNGSGIISINDATKVLRVFTGGSESMRIDSSGNLLVSTTDTNPTNDSEDTFAFVVNKANHQVRVRSHDLPSLRMNRTGTDGEITQFYKNGSPVASIGTATNELEIKTSGTRYLELQEIVGLYNSAWTGNLQMTPTVSSVDLGNTGTQWDNLFLSGGVYLGGTGSANKLDDYEEGTWTVDLKEGANSLTLGNNVGVYTKVGDVVTVWATANNITKSGTGALRMYGLPFASKSDSGLALYVSGAVRLTRFTSAYAGVPICRADDGTSYIRFTWLYNGNGNDQEMLASDIADATNADINICFTYKTA